MLFAIEPAESVLPASPITTIPPSWLSVVVLFSMTRLPIGVLFWMTAMPNPALSEAVLATIAKSPGMFESVNSVRMPSRPLLLATLFVISGKVPAAKSVLNVVKTIPNSPDPDTSFESTRNGLNTVPASLVPAGPICWSTLTGSPPAAAEVNRLMPSPPLPVRSATPKSALPT